ncbi:hypothetical protein AOLI_G00143370 [Acnodon oligacanthus]
MTTFLRGQILRHSWDLDPPDHEHSWHSRGGVEARPFQPVSKVYASAQMFGGPGPRCQGGELQFQYILRQTLTGPAHP